MAHGVGRNTNPHPTRKSTSASGLSANRNSIGGTTVLGIDPGLERTGYAVLSGPNHRVIEAGVIRTATRSSLSERLREIAVGLDEIMDEHTVALVAVEDLFAHYAHPRTAILMGHARGVVLLAAGRRGIEVQSLLPTRVKKALTGNGHASKAQVQRAIAVTLGLRRLPEPADVADALAIAWCAAQSVAQRGPISQKRNGKFVEVVA